MMHGSQALIDFLHLWEDCRLTPYRDDAGHWTVGWGHKIVEGEPIVPITQDQADEIFLQDLDIKERQLADVLNEFIVSQHQYDALLSFCYNLGAPRLRRSTLLAELRQGRIYVAACEFTKWELAGGALNHGVLRRRCGEQAIFLIADYSRGP